MAWSWSSMIQQEAPNEDLQREEIAHSDVREWVLGTKSTAKAKLYSGLLANNVP